MKLAHVILRVADMERALAFYRDMVGLEVLSASPAFSFLDAGSVRLALNGSDDAALPDGSLTELVLEVDVVGAAYEAMAGRGVAFEVAPREVMRDGDRSLWAAHFRDPDGHVLSISGWVAAAS